VEILHAIVLGIVQGLSEFLPISSSGHLELTRWLFGWDDLSPELETSFDVAVHMGAGHSAPMVASHGSSSRRRCRRASPACC
jgi:undecaprenyl pyrophosphate phosphatase UppP